MTREEHCKIVDAVIDAHKDNEMGGKYAKAFNHGVQSAFNRVCKALKDIEQQQQPNRCDSCTHSEEQDGSNCYECVKGMADNFEPQPKTSYISIDVNKLAKEVAEKALDEITYEGKTVREWVEIIVKQPPCEDCISREAVIDYITANYGFCHNLIECVRALSPVTSERPKGKWIWDLRMGLHKCSVCGKFCDFDYLYCPNCGSYNGGGEDG